MQLWLWPAPRAWRNWGWDRPWHGVIWYVDNSGWVNDAGDEGCFREGVAGITGARDEWSDDEPTTCWDGCTATKFAANKALLGTKVAQMDLLREGNGHKWVFKNMRESSWKLWKSFCNAPKTGKETVIDIEYLAESWEQCLYNKKMKKL